MKRYGTLAAAVFALLFAAACGSSGLGDIFGGGTNNKATSEIRGTVDSVDVNSHSIVLTNVSGTSSNLRGGSSGNTARVYYDNNTTVQYQGRSFRPEDLERGDQVSIRVDQSSNQLIAQSMDVLYDAHGGMASSTGGTYGTLMHATVRSVDTYGHTISVDRGYGSPVTVQYDNNTPVYSGGRTYSPSSLQSGDEIDLRTTDLGGGRLGAQDITVTRSVSSNGTYGGSSTNATATIRGTVRNIDTVNQTIELDSSSWISGFQTGSGSSRLIVHYDSNARVDFNGQAYPVTNLERGDVVEIQMQNTGGGNYLAQRVVLIKNVRQ